jgi:uncharacterized protein
MSNDVVRILSIDGGGIRGIIPAMVVKELLGVLKAQDVFHIITGTSTGGIIACGLAKPTPIDVNDIVDLYVKHGGEIFKKGILDKFHFLHGAEYQPNALENYLGSKFSQVWLSDIQNVELLVPSYAIGLPDDTQSLPMFFRSWQARGRSLGSGATKEEYDFQLQSVCRATSAAPTYLPPAVIRNRAAQSFTMIDGGVFANNPTLCAIVEAHRLYHAEMFLVVSIGTGHQATRVNTAKAMGWGDLEWAPQLINIFMDGNSQTTHVEMDHLLGPKAHYRFNIPLSSTLPDGTTVDAAMDDASPANIAALQTLAQELIQKEAIRFAEVRQKLAEPRPPLTIKDGPLTKTIMGTPTAAIVS